MSYIITEAKRIELFDILYAQLDAGGLMKPEYVPNGSVVQVVNTVIETRGSQSITGNTVDNIIGVGSEFSLTITPKYSNSYFKIDTRWTGEVSTAWDVVFNVMKDEVRVNNSDTSWWSGLSYP